MNLTYYEIKNTTHLVEEFYSVKYSDKDVPFKNTIIPMAFSGIVFTYSGDQYTIFENKKNNLADLAIFGQFSKSYEIFSDSVGYCCGISFKPTALYKITNLDIFKLANSHIPFKLLRPELAKIFETIFLKHKDNSIKLFSEIEKLLNSLPLQENKDTLIIDNIIEEIHKKEGLLSVIELLKIVPFSQKTLETKFKKMVGLTPSKYIKIHRFLNLMKQFEHQKINLKDLIYMYDYYDESHFAKDFRSFTSKSIKEYFKEDFLIIKEALNKK